MTEFDPDSHIDHSAKKRVSAFKRKITSNFKAGEVEVKKLKVDNESLSDDLRKEEAEKIQKLEQTVAEQACVIEELKKEIEELNVAKEEPKEDDEPIEKISAE